MTAAALAQAPQQPKQPAPKSQKELEAILAIQNAADAEGRIKAAEELLAKFRDTEFKEFALQMVTLSHQQNNDFDNMLIAGERTLEVNPENVVVLVAMAQAIPQRTREHDLDKEEKLKKAEEFAMRAQKVIPNLAKFNPAIADEEWAGYKKGAMSQTHEAIGLAAFVRKDFAKAETALKAAVEISPQPEPTVLYRLAMVYQTQNKLDAALAVLDKAIAAGGVPVGDKELAAEQKAAILKQKAAAGAAPAAEPKKQ